MYLKMKEASELCKLIKRNIVFTCETASMDSKADVFIRAADLTNNRAIVWSFETFCERVEGLKAYYQALCQVRFKEIVDPLGVITILELA